MKAEELGHKVWIDLEDLPAASLWRDEIAEAIERADVFLFALTLDSASSLECQKELDHALHLQKRIIPVVLRDVEPEQVDSHLRNIDWVWLRPEDDEQRSMQRLENAITTDLDHLHRHTRFLLRALEWRTNRDRSLLLRGGNLREAEQWLAQSPGKEPAPIPIQEELVRASRKGEKRRRMWQAAVAVLLVAISGIAVYVAYQRAQTARTDLSRRLARDSTSAGSLDRMLLLAVAAHEIAPTGDAIRSLLAALEKAPQLLTLLHGHQGEIETLAFHPDEPLLVSAGSDGAIRLWDTQTWRSLGNLPAGKERIARLVFSPDGKLLLTGDWAGRISRWDPVRHKKILPDLEAGGGLVESLAVHAEGRYLAAGYSSGALLWDLGTNPPVSVALPVEDRRIPEVAFDPEGRMLALLEGTESLVVWDFSEGRLSNRRQYSPGMGTSALVWHPGGQQIVLGHSDGSLAWVDAAEMAEIRRVPGSGAGVLHLAFDGDGAFLASGCGDGRIRVWSEDEEEALLTLPGQGRVFAVTFQAGTGKLASAGTDPTIHLWDPGLFQPLSRVALQGRSSVQQVVLDPDGRWLVAGDLNGRVVRVSFSGSGEIEEIPVDTGGEVGGMALAGNQLLWSGAEGRFGLWDLEGGSKPLAWHVQGINRTAVALQKDGAAFATGSEVGRISIWRRNPESGDFRETSLPTEPGQTLGRTMDLSFSPDGRFLASGDNDDNVLLWDVTSLRLLRAWKVPGATTDLSFSPDGKRLAVVNGGDGRITLLDPSRQEVAPPETGECGRVFSVAFRREGRFLVTGCDDGSLEHIEINPWRSLGRVRAYGEFVYSLSPIHGGDLMASGTSDGQVLVWDFDEISWKRRACRRSNRDLPKDVQSSSGLPADFCSRLLRDAPQAAPGLRIQDEPAPSRAPYNVAEVD